MSDTVDPLAGRTMGEEVPLDQGNYAGTEVPLARSPEVPLPAGNWSGAEVSIPGYRPSGFQDGYEDARQYGYRWAEIRSHIAQATSTAADYGYSQDEIDEHLGFSDPTVFEADTRNSWARQFSYDPDLLTGLSAPDPKIDLTMNPDLRRSYASALLNGEVKGPQDFAYRYAAKALEAAHDMQGLLSTPESDAVRSAAAAAAAEELIPLLPTRENLADATVSLGRKMTEDDAVRLHNSYYGADSRLLRADARARLMKHWADTGKEPLLAAIAMQAAPPYEERLLTPTPQPGLGERLMANATDAFYRGTLLGSATLGALAVIAAGLPEDEFRGTVYQRPPGPATAMSPQQAQAEIERIKAGQKAYEQMPGFDGPVEGGAAFMGQLVGGMLSPESWLLRFPGFNWSVTKIAGTPTTTALSRVLEAGFSQGLVNIATDPLAQQGVIAAGIQEGWDPLRTAASFPLGFVVGGALAGLGEAGRAAIARRIADELNELPEPTVTVTDLTKEPGLTTREVKVSEALETPEPAAFEPPKAVAEGASPEPPKFVETASPAAKLERIAELELENRGIVPNPMESGTFFQRRLAEGETTLTVNNRLEDFPAFHRDLLARMETDKAALDLAHGADTAASWGAYIRQTFSNLFKSESGAGPGFPPLTPRAVVDLEPGSRRAKIAGKNYADALIRQYANGLNTQRSEFVAQGFERFFKDLSPFMPQWEKAVDAAVKNKGAVADAMGSDIGRMLNAIEGKGVVDANSSVAPYVRYRSEMNEWIKGILDEQVAAGNLNPIQYRDWYIAHTVTPESLNKIGGPTSSGRTGNLGFTRERTHDTYEDLLTEGYDPLYRNPILMDISSIDTKLKAATTVQMQGIAKEQGWMRYYASPREAARDGFKPLTGLNSEKHVAVPDKIGPNGERIPQNDIVQKLYGRDGVDVIWNNWVGWETMQRNAKVATVEDAMLKMKNGSTYLKLMWPGFHVVTEMKLSMANGLANAFTELGFGITHPLTKAGAQEFARGLKDLVTSPFKAAEYIAEGAGERAAYRAMRSGTDKALDDARRALGFYVEGGGNIAGRSKAYSASDSPTLWKMHTRGTLTQELHKDLMKLTTFPNMRDDPSGAALAKDFGNIATIPFKEMARGVTSATAPLWDHAIPLIKAGASIERIQTYIRQYPTASDDAIRAYARQVIENAEDRFGEQNVANLFWPVIVKRITNQLMLSSTWTYGTIHAMLQGVGYNPGRGFEWNPVATTNLMGQLGVIAFTNAAWTYAQTGKLPESTLDYMVPFANARGVARILIPGEEKEYYDWFKIVRETYSVYQDAGYGAGVLQALQSSWHYGMGKLAPYLNTFKTAVTGENAVGVRPGYAPGGTEGWVLDELLPITALQWKENEKIGLGVAANLSGIRKAGNWLGQPYEEWRKGQQGLHKKWTAEQLRMHNKKEGIASGGSKAKKESAGERRWRTGQ